MGIYGRFFFRLAEEALGRNLTPQEESEVGVSAGDEKMTSRFISARQHSPIAQKEI